MAFNIIKLDSKGTFAIVADEEILLTGIPTRELAQGYLDGLNERKLDYESLYQKYPRKMGKLRGMQWLKNNCRSQKKLDYIHSCLENYKSQIETEAREDEFIMYFSSWLPIHSDWEKKTDTQSFNLTKPSDLKFRD